MKVRIGSLMLLTLGVFAIMVFLLYEPGPVPSYPFATLAAGLLFIIVSIITMMEKDTTG
jgi:hypothetical protein